MSAKAEAEAAAALRELGATMKLEGVDERAEASHAGIENKVPKRV